MSVMTKIADKKKKGISAYIVKPVKLAKKVDWRDYVIPTGNKKKRNISGKIDEILYGGK